MPKPKSKTDVWKKEEVARAQLELVTKQLGNPQAISPFAAFIRAMNGIALNGISLSGKSLLDVGCGVGHYGVICSKFFPQIEYHGVDYSRAMIAEAKKLCPTGKFRVKEFSDVNFWDYDIVFVGQVLEYLDNPWDGIDELFDEKHHGIVILHRLRLTEGVSHRIESEPMYCGLTAQNYQWNLNELTNFIKLKYGKVIDVDLWEGNATLTVQDSK